MKLSVLNSTSVKYISLSVWSDEETKMLIHIYSEYIPEIGPKKRFKQKKDMWMTISSRMPGKTAKQCEERFKTVLRRKRKWALKNQNANGTTKKQQQKLPLDLPILPHEPQIVWNYTPPVKQYSKTTPNRHKGSSNNTKSSKTNLNTSSQLPEAIAADQGNKSPNKVITRQQQMNNHKQHTAAAHNISTNINQSSPKKDRIKQEHMVGIHENHWSTTTNQLNKAKEKPQYEQRRAMEIPKISYTNDVAAIIQDTLLEIAARREEARDRRHREKMEAVTKLQNTLQAILEEGRKKM